MANAAMTEVQPAGQRGSFTYVTSVTLSPASFCPLSPRQYSLVTSTGGMQIVGFL